MIDNIEDIKEYYTFGYDETTRLERHQLEREMTLRYFSEYLPSRGNILEIGAASGVYTLWLAKRGYHVTAIDISEKLLEECRSQVRAAGLQDHVMCVLSDARDLSNIKEQDFDALLLMGPLYHLVLMEDRLAALREATSHLKLGGIFFSAHISRYGVIGHLMQRVPDWIESDQHVRSLIDKGCDPEVGPKYGFRAYYTTLEEIVPLHEKVGLEKLVLAGVEPAISADDESYNRLEGHQRGLWLDLLYELSQEPSLMASSRHLLYIGRKPI